MQRHVVTEHFQKGDFFVVDNLDPELFHFVIKDKTILEPLVINHGSTPCITGVAELTDFHGKWYHVGLSKDRTKIADDFKKLLEFCSEVKLVLGVNPLQTLEIKHDIQVTTNDEVYLAIADARSQRKAVK